MPELSFADAPYRRCIPALTETAARPGDSSSRVCGDNQKRYTPGFTALTERGVAPHSRLSGAMVEEAGRCVTSQALLCV
ncbi:hypothetical protein AAG23_004446 [Escherichia coli]|uniref:hypothetical protein n=1 Tax=Escherichia TaxID=561 RepID=UPI000B20C8B7|nr:MULTISPECIES: hypothetical protein [Escherichia]EFA8854787.1 hypothetical protein [Escherichia coli O177]EED0863675.1 hypothetical protein [Escherichia coli]EEQ6797034.1 hypothetical protein [Escherichia coli]EEU5779871.1 hypothetical protein [Escherichia coli]EEV4976977.1 hypothetical protein [Escherichia coli]